MKRNDNSCYFKNWTTKKLKREAKAYHYSIYEIECFGTKDIIALNGILKELRNRGVEPMNKLTFN